MSDCKVFRREIGEAAGHGELSGAAAAHADGCRACGEALRQREAVRGLVGGLARVEAPADFEFRLRARMAAATKERRGPFGGLRLAYKLAPVAVVAAFLVIAASLYLRQPPRGGQSVATAPAAGEVASNAGRAQTQAGVQTKETPARVDSQNDSRTTAPAPVASAPAAVVEQARTGKPQFSVTTAQKLQHAARRSAEAARVGRGAGEVATLNTTVAGVSSAEVITRDRTLPITLETGAAPLRLVLRDGRGATRVVPVRSVSFGAQDVIAREGTRRQTNAFDGEGVW
ncbi:MAG TPA: hypothetical protein VJ866_18850 [Pyrinomonadaceae bacterium]|nr:hypothetical protein [Pyrinomonadaceae bacterium]